MSQHQSIERAGIYNVEYFSSSTAAVFIGDIWVDEITSISYGVSQSRTPLYGYADTYFRDVSEGQVIVQGQFSLNFKEAGYLWLILNRYRTKIRGKESIFGNDPFVSGDTVVQENIERAFNNAISRSDKIKVYKNLASLSSSIYKNRGQPIQKDFRNERLGVASNFISRSGNSSAASLGGFASEERSKGGLGKAENAFENFEDRAWQRSQEELDNETRRADDFRLNPFDVYVTFGDYAGDNSANHTVQKLTDVHIISSGKQIVPDGQPIQETYQFIARNLV